MKKTFALLLTAALSVGIFSACGPKKPSSAVLEVDKETMYADGVDKVNFTVKLDGKDVTNLYQVCEVGMLCLTSHSFSTTEVGEHTFYAINEAGEKSGNQVTIEAMRKGDTGSFDPSKAIVKNVAFFTYTATWCSPCYDLKLGYKRAFEKPYGKNIVLVNLHTAVKGDDAQFDDTIGASDGIVATKAQVSTGQFGFINLPGYPTTLVELDDAFTAGTASDIEDMVESYIENSPKTALKVTSAAKSGIINTTVTVGAKEAGDYSIGIILTEDNVMANQSDSDGITIPNYTHTNVAREIGSSSIFGDSIGAMTVGQEVEEEFTIDVSEFSYNLRRSNLVIYVTYDKGGRKVIDNAVRVPAIGETGWNYAE